MAGLKAEDFGGAADAVVVLVKLLEDESRAENLQERAFAMLFYNERVLTDEDKQWITTRLAEERQWVVERIEKLETTLLTEFHKWASPVEMRQRTHAAAIRALDTEVESLSDRLKNLEGR